MATKHIGDAGNGKRGLCGEGMNNNLNKTGRLSEDVRLAKAKGHHYQCDEGQALVKAVQAHMLTGVEVAKAYSEYASKNGMSHMTAGGTKIVGRLLGESEALKSLIRDEPKKE